MKMALAFPSDCRPSAPWVALPAPLRRPQRWFPPPPAQADPLLNVVGQASPRRLHRDFEQAAQAELPHTDLGLDPKIAELRHPPSLPVDLLRGFALHLRPEGGDLRDLFRAHQHASLGGVVARTALRFESAGSTIGRRSPVVVLEDSHASVLPLPTQHLARRTLIGVTVGPVRKGLRTKL